MGHGNITMSTNKTQHKHKYYLIELHMKHSCRPIHCWSGSKTQATWLVAWRSGNAFHPINDVTLCRAGLVLQWVTACEQVKHLGM